ncbi:MAG: PEP-CTERM sorting domain-containing protein [Thermoguttaceae bacterium]|jgi:hypothetical protein
MRNKLVLLSLICVLGLGVSSAYAVAYYDDFSSGSLAAYNQVWLLSNDAQGATCGASASTGQFYTTRTGAGSINGSNAQQMEWLANSSLDVGEILRANVSLGQTAGLYFDLGICVNYSQTPNSLTPPATGGVRQDEISVYLKDSTGNIGYYAADGSSGTTQIASNSGAITGSMPPWSSITGLWIARTSATTFYLGYTNTVSGDTLLTTVTVTNTNIGNAIGIYADSRTAGTSPEYVDNLSVSTNPVPEPATITMLVFGIAGMGLWLRKRG